MDFYHNVASTSTSIAMMGAVISFVGVGLLILIFSERMFHGLGRLIYFLGNQILISRRAFSQKYIDENKATKNQIYGKQIDVTRKEISLSDQKEWLEKILKMKV